MFSIERGFIFLDVMIFRKATCSDYEALHAVRMAVHENVLLNTSLVTPSHYKEILEQKGRGWVCEDTTGKATGFAIVDLSRSNIWALFIHPDFESKGIARMLHQLMLNWSFGNKAEKLWLTTELGTRAETFYLKAGWERKGLEPDGEVRFEMTKDNWLKRRLNAS